MSRPGGAPGGAGPGRDTRDWTQAAIELASGVTAAGMFAYGVALSYQVLHAIATAAGLPAWASGVWPLGFEAFMAAAALNALAEQRRRRHLAAWWQRVPWYPWTLTGLTAGGSLLLNWFHPAIPLDPPPGWLVSLVYGLPPLAAVFAWHLFLQRLADRHHPAAPQADASGHDHQVPVPVPPGAGDPAPTGTLPAPGPAVPLVLARDPVATGLVPAPATGDGAGPTSSRARRRSRPSGPTRTETGTGAGAGLAVPAELVARATAVAQAFQAEHARPISRDALGRALHVGNRAAGELLRAVRATPPPAGDDPAPVPVPRDGTAAGTVPAPGPAVPPVPAPDLDPVEGKPTPGPVAVPGGPVGNGTSPRPGDRTTPAPASPSSSRTPAHVP
jgi:hypothetical protein